MENLRQYLLSATAAAVLCAILLSISDRKAPWFGIVRVLCGVFLSVTLIAPFADFRLGDIDQYLGDLRAEGTAASEAGVDAAEEALAAIIKSRTEAYILDKAESMGASVHVEVVIPEESFPSPGLVRIQGVVSPYVKAQLRSWIRDTVGIGVDNQLWI